MDIRIRPARTSDISIIRSMVQPLATERVLLDKDKVSYYEAVQEFLVAENTDDEILGFGALHVMWEHLAEVRTLATADEHQGRGVGGVVLNALLDKAEDLGVQHVFCLTFETSFFQRHGFEIMEDQSVLDPEVFNQLLRSPDEGIAEFLDLARVKPNTLGNTRMIIDLDNRRS
ncbi:MAG TPA: amino-acid N-acetyltransferase [Enteractinococcus helveticum]|uniref:Amino-acid N-acetyltransferase n=1 Tax=Enteractinococcus helveticum TaxID=1837282 RepID=A0A921FPC5_9MICC|nr:amino-acid N-acetyltransferase [Enteractinococcus helveticum]HJF15314.1 amino-acid N-acetyltransferase [Enteractinococcus helveticum]